MRARNIKPGFFLNCELSDVDFAARLLFIGLWCYADREGRFEWKPKQIKAAIFPYDNVHIDKLLKSLLSLHVITCHDTVGYVEHFKKHQNPHPHEAKSVLPEKPEQNQCHDMSCNVTECNADVMIPDSLIPDIIIPDSSSTKNSVSGEPKRTSPKMTDEEWIVEMKENPAYRHINFTVEIGKAQAWAKNKNRKCSRGFLLNWFNKIESPLMIDGIMPRESCRKSYEQERNERNIQAGLEWVEESYARIR